MVSNPRANILTVIAHTNKYLWHIVVFILAYTAIQFPIWNRVASWAAAVRPKAGIQPVSEPELRQRLLAINAMDVPFHVVEKKGKKLDVVWRLADAKWVGLMTANKVSRVEIMRLRLSERDKSCRVVEISKAIKASADGTTLQFAFSFSFFRGIVFGQWEYEKQFGLIFRDGGLTFDTAYEYKFSLSEIKEPHRQYCCFKRLEFQTGDVLFQNPWRIMVTCRLTILNFDSNKVMLLLLVGETWNITN